MEEGVIYSYKVALTKPGGGNATFSGHNFDSLAEASKAFSRVLDDFVYPELIPQPSWWQFWKFRQEIWASIGRAEEVNRNKPSCEVGIYKWDRTMTNAELAAKHGAPWAKQLILDELERVK